MRINPALFPRIEPIESLVKVFMRINPSPFQHIFLGLFKTPAFVHGEDKCNGC